MVWLARYTVILAALLAWSPHVVGDIVLDLGRGPVRVHVPAGRDAALPAPLVVLLHGYGGSGAVQEAYMRFRPLQDEFGFLFVYPDGTVDTLGNRFWNATDACCDLDGTGVDDSGYLRELIEAIHAQLNVDVRRIYVVGHSNGGFMAHRLACDHADRIAAIVSLAGATFDDVTHCAPAETVHVLQIHGTADRLVQYKGGFFMTPYPGAVESVETWAAFDGCEPAPNATAPPLDLDCEIPGAETLITPYDQACTPGGSATLWTIVGGVHVPTLCDDFSRLVIEFLYAHPKLWPGDLNCDGVINVADVPAFVHAVLAPTAYATAYPDCDRLAGDVNGDGELNSGDIPAFIDLLINR